MRVLRLLLCATVISAADPVMEEYNRAWQAVGQRRLDEAIGQLQAIIAKAPHFHRAYRTLVRAYQLKKAEDQGILFFTSLLARKPGTAFAHYALGLLQNERVQESDALSHYTACLAADPSAAECYALLAATLASASKGTAGIEDLRRRLPATAERYSCIAFVNFALAKTKVSEGIELSDRCVEAMREIGHADALATALDVARKAYLNAFQYEKALAFARQELQIQRALGDSEGELTAMERVGGLLIQLGDTDAAITLLEQALQNARELNHRDMMAETLGSLTDAYQRHGDDQRALARAEELYRIAKDDGNWYAVFAAVERMGSIHARQGDFDEAHLCFQEMRQLAGEHSKRPLEAFALRNISVQQHNAGDYFNAIRNGLESVRIFKDMGMTHQAGAGINNIGLIYASLGDYSSAIQYTEESLQSAVDHQDKSEQQRNLTDLADHYLRLGQPKPALAKSRRALELAREVRSPSLTASTLLAMADAHKRLGEMSQATSRIEEALEIARKTNQPAVEADGLRMYGDIQLKRAHITQAGGYYRRSLDAATRTGLPDLVMQAQCGLAEVARGRGDLLTARDLLRGAVGTVQNLRQNAPTPELRAGFVRENARLYEDIIEVLFELHLGRRAASYDREALSYAEGGRARAFLDMLTESKADIHPGLTEEDRHQERQLNLELARAMSALTENPSDANRRAADRAEQKLTEWVVDVRTRNPRYKDLKYPDAFDAGRMQALSASLGAAILEYALGERRSFLWVVTPNRVRMIELPPKKAIQEQVRRFRNAAAHRPQPTAFGNYVEPSRGLYQSLFEPAIGQLAGITKLVIVPDGILYYLPFEALTNGATTRPGGKPHFLIEDFAVTYAPSASVLAALEHGGNRGFRSMDLLAYGDPVFSKTEPPNGGPGTQELVRSVYRAAGVRFPELPNTRREVESIAGLFPVAHRRTFLGPAATEASVKQQKLTDYRILHFATHALIDERSASRSGIVLSLVNSGPEDGVLRTSEIFNLKLNADLVVLSACQTGLGEVVRGEGMVGLTRAFLYAGSPRLTVSLWDVNDASTPEFMKLFYKGLQDGLMPAAALREAKLALLHSGRAAFEHPYLWAPFVLVGAF